MLPCKYGQCNERAHGSLSGILKRAKKLIKFDDKFFVGASRQWLGLAYFYTLDRALPEIVLVLAVHRGVNSTKVVGFEDEVSDGCGCDVDGLLLSEGGADFLLQLGVVGLVGRLVDKAIYVEVLETGEFVASGADAQLGSDAHRGFFLLNLKLVRIEELTEMIEQVALDGVLADCTAICASASGDIGRAGDSVLAAPIIAVKRHMPVFLSVSAVVPK